MNEKLKKNFSEVKYEPSQNLSSAIWRTLITRNERVVRVKLFVFSIISLASGLGLIPVFKLLSNDLARSGFYQYLSLLFSSNGSIASYWQEFMFSIAESLPLASILFLLGLIFVFFLSLRYLIKQIIRNQLVLTTSSAL